jgi:drug/metabolite transporter (DMT)-like permease
VTSVSRPGDERSDHLPLAPTAAFVLIWSSGYIAGPLGVEAMDPLMLVAARFALATLVVGVVARAWRGPLRATGHADRGTLGKIAVVGFFMNGFSFAAMYLAFEAGMGATLGSLLHSLSPVLTAVLAGVLIRERLGGVQVLGFVVGVAGVLLVLGPDIDAAGGVLGLVLGALSMLGLSLGTLGQRWIGHGPDPWWSATIQFAASAPPVLVLALIVEGTDVVQEPAQAVAALVWLGVVNSVVGLLLLGVLVRAGGAGASASVFFLMPPVTAVLAWIFFSEAVNVREVLGLVVAVVGVAVATRSRRVRPVRTEPVG